MKLSNLYTKAKEEGKTVLSFEVFPPKKTSGIETVYKALDELAKMNPAYISVTYGAVVLKLTILQLLLKR